VNSSGLYPRVASIRPPRPRSGWWGSADPDGGGDGSGQGLSAALSRWRRRLAVHDPGKIIADLALGGDCLADLAAPCGPCAEPGVYGRV
jgi:hypothetical protein